MTTRWVIGLASGSSADGVEAALAEVTGVGLALRARLVSSSHQPYPRDLTDMLLRASGAAPCEIRQVGLLHRLLGETFAAAARHVADRASFSLQKVQCLGCPGHTVWHDPEGRFPASLSLGMATVVAERTGITTVSDFRSRDLAAGGQGVPLTALVDYLLFRNPDENRLLLHLGGLARVVHLPARATSGRDRLRGRPVQHPPQQPDAKTDERPRASSTRAASTPCRVAASSRCSNAGWRILIFRDGRPRACPGTVLATISPSRPCSSPSRRAGACTTSSARPRTSWPAACPNRCAASSRKTASPPVSSSAAAASATASSGISSNTSCAATKLERLDAYGVPGDARKPLAFGLLAALLLDGVPASVPSATGAPGSRLLGNLTPGGNTNWARCLSWMARHAGLPEEMDEE